MQEIGEHPMESNGQAETYQGEPNLDEETKAKANDIEDSMKLPVLQHITKLEVSQ